MFAAVSPIEQFPFQSRPHYFAPARSSPLSSQQSTVSMFPPSPSGPETTTHFPSFSPNSTHTTTTGTTTQANTDNDDHRHHHPTRTSKPSTTPTYAQRYTSTISNPLTNPALHRSYTTSSSPAARSKRRDAFLNRVKQDRDNGRFDSRGEQLMLMEYVAERKRWGEVMRRRADGFDRMCDGSEEDMVEYEYEGETDDVDIQALDEYISNEQAMESALLETMQQQEQEQEQIQTQTQTQASFGQGGNQRIQADTSSFSDEEYDDIFMDLVDPMPQGHDMDMSG